MASTSDKAARKAERKLLQQQRIQHAQQQAQLAAQQQPVLMENGSSKIAHEEEILEAIDQLRRRKARPDADRICNYLLRKFEVDVSDTIAALRQLIETEKVIQVDYKGNTSYRNASKWSRLQLYKNRPEGFVKEKFNSNTVATALGQLVILEPDYLEQGVPALRLVEQLLDGVSNPTSRRMVEDFLTKEVTNGNLARLSNGNYSVADGNNTSSASPQQNGVATPKSKGSTVGSAAATPVKKAAVISYDLNELEDLTLEEHDSSSNTLRSRQTSPKNDMETMKTEECYEVIIGRRLINENDENKNKQLNGELSNGCHKEDSVKHNGRILNSSSLEEDESKNITEVQSNHKKSKTERKQRLCVRNDDSPDLLFKYEDFRKDTSYKDEDDRRYDENDRLSEDGENDQDAGRSSTNPSPTSSHTNAGGFRSARRKRAKKVFDPSDNMVVKRKRGRYSNAAKAALANAQQDSQDSIKLNSVKENIKDTHRHCNECSKDKDEALIACRDCTVRVHPSCIYTPEEMALKADTSWQCEDCKTCAYCYETKSVGPMVTCFNCDDSYHYSCHSPKVSSLKAKWFCYKCSPKQSKPVLQNSNSNCNQYNSISMRISNNNNSSNNNNNIEQSINSTTPVVLSPQVSPIRNVPDQIDDDKHELKDVDPNIPDVSKWTSDQVYQYFARLFPKEAEIFRSQEIDGQALLLLERNNVIQNFRLLLGPALKVWRHVIKLQYRRDDTSLYWL